MTDKETPHLSLDERAYREVRQMIVNGDLKPGTQIVQDALADRLGLSRPPLRKAIASLAQENFLEMDARALDPYANPPHHATAAGKVLLASMEDDEISTCLSSSGMKRFTSRTITSSADLHEHLKEVRDQGYALELGEHAEGVNSIAVPIISGERAIGALVVLSEQIPA